MPAATVRSSSIVSGRTEIVGIQYLRAIAAIGVVIPHLGGIFGFDFFYGQVGVDVFFVISGFIIWLVTRQRETKAGTFFVKRFLRIVPFYWAVTITVATAARIKPNLFPFDNPDTHHVILSLLFVPHLSPEYVHSGQSATALERQLWPFITQGWTLNYEMLFYVLFALTLARFRRYQIHAVALLLIGLTALGFLLHPNTPVGFTYTSPLLLEFLGGILICQAWLAQRVLPIPFAILAIILGVAGSLAYFYFERPIPHALFVGPSAMLVVYGVVSLDLQNSLPRIKFLKFLGDASYSIYLTHYVAWLIFSLFIARIGGSINVYLDAPTVLFAIVFGSAVHVFIEKPLGRFLNKLFLRARPLTA